MPTHTIKSGDTAFSLASTFQTSVTAIQSANQGLNPNALQIGQVINVPEIAAGPPVPNLAGSGTGRYTIQGGDTFALIASNYNTTAAFIQSMNPGINPNNFQIGQVIKVSTSPTNVRSASKIPINLGGTFIPYSGPAFNFPHPNQWASSSALWSHNSGLMRNSNSPVEIDMITTPSALSPNPPA